MRKRYWFLIVLLGITAGTLFLIRSWTPGQIEIDIKQVRTSIKNDTLHATILLENRALSKLSRYTEFINFTVTLDTFQVAQGKINYTKKTDSVNFVRIPVHLSIKDMQAVINVESDSALLTIHTDIAKMVPVIGLKIWEGEKRIRIFRPRPLKYKQTGISDFSNQRDTIRFILEGFIQNHNPIAITLLKTTLSMRIDDRFTAYVAMPPNLNIPPRDSVFVKTNIEIHDFKVLKDGLAILFSRDAIPYIVTGDITLRLDSVDILEPIEMDVIHTGNISLSPFKKKD